MKRDRDFIQRGQLLLPWSPGRTISTSKVAEILFTSETTVRKMIEDNTLRGYKLRPDKSRSPYRVFRDSVEEHLRRLKSDSGDGSSWRD